ncbi:hypothetical protein FOL47_001652 [Perkinsus chesapeaki]|uniref:Uncharacterized protein n=1 Tax=Perkinsus chesapeaki TaxID=330153 RepID=A0A7J6MIE9_PERCH|nr:hypothetical protein FOL47_001652 [Perkinsus chesapeaki]
MPSPRKGSTHRLRNDDEEPSSPQVDYGEEWEEIYREEEQARIAAGRPKKKASSSSSQKPRLNLWDDCENMPGAKPNATPVQREYFESRCLKVWKETAKESQAHEEERSRELELEEAECLENEITDLFEMFPLLDSALIQDIYLCSERDWDATVDTLLVKPDGIEGILEMMSYSAILADVIQLSLLWQYSDRCTDITLLALIDRLKLSGENDGLDAKVSKPPPKMDDENEFPLLIGRDDWQVVPRYIMEEGAAPSKPPESSYLAKAKASSSDKTAEKP